MGASNEFDEENIITLDLEPIALLFHSTTSSDGQRRKLAEEIDVIEEKQDLPLLSLHPFSNAVYSSLVELDNNGIHDEDRVKTHNKMVGEMNASRHLSRFEILHIEANDKNDEISNNFEQGITSESPVGDGKQIHDYRRLQQNINLRGGLPPLIGGDDSDGNAYNDFQSAPLSQGYGTHYATVWVGTPTPQRKTLIVDTGSHHTAFPCKGCIDCGEDHHTDPYFDPDKSNTFSPLSCHECRYEAKCSPIGNEFEGSGAVSGLRNACMVRQSYTEGSSWAAYQVKDMLFCGGRDILSAADPLDQRFSVEFVFGCKVRSSGLFHSQLADGIMGLSQHEAALPSVMYKQGKIKQGVFSLCFRKEVVVSKKGVSAGVITFGGIDRSLSSSPMVFAKNTARTGWYTVYVKNVYLQPGDSAKDDHTNIIKVPIDTYAVNSEKGVIIDSGTTDSYLHKSLSQPFNAIWKQLTGSSYSNAPIRLTREQLHNLPTIYIQIMAFNNGAESIGPNSSDAVPSLVGTLDPSSSNDVLLAIPSNHYMEYSPSKDVYTPRFYFTESRGSVLGANALQGHDVMFDWENGKIGFAESDCKVSETTWEGEGLASEGSGARGEDCILQREIISEACFESVDASLCANDRNAILQGRETKIMAVEYPGTVNGLKCEEVIKKDMFQDKLEEYSVEEVSCNGLGICTTIQKCEMTCESYDNAKGLVEAIDVHESEFRKCNGSWSSCLESCNQSKLTSRLMSDGLCHEMKDTRLSRTCHTEYCGISDPCVIPFVVHVILAFRGVNNEFWTKDAERSLIESFSATIQNSKDQNMFDPTDVELLMTSPWFDDVSSGEGVKLDMTSTGVKAVLEVHIYNEHAFTKNINFDSEGKVQTIFERMNSAQPASVCRNSDIFEFAQKAHEIHFNLDQSDFMRKMGMSLQKHHLDNKDGSAEIFSPFFSDEKNMDESMVVSSWTIKTAVGGSGSIYDHKLDPFPGAINYVHVSSAYLGLSPFTILSVIILCVFGFNVFRRRRRERINSSNTMSGHMSFIPKPFEMIKRKLGTNGSYNKKFSDGTVQENANLIALRQHSKTRKLDDILSN